MVKPIQESNQSKKEQVRDMFNSIAHKYVFLNSVLSAGIDKIWRKKAVRFLKKQLSENPNPLIADIATGTADFAIALMPIKQSKVIGLDISEGMLKEGQKIVNKTPYKERIELKLTDAESIGFAENHFDAAVCAFGVRNFENLEQGLSEICRVIKKGSYFVILEFSEPKVFPIKQLYHFYSKTVMPFIGRLFSKSSTAYTYLPNSIKAFKKDEELVEVLKNVGFEDASYKHLSFGIVSMYFARK